METGGSTQAFEGGPTDSYSIAPFTSPGGTVTVAVASGPQTLVSTDGVNFAPAQNLVFTTAAAQTVYVRAINDALNEGPQTSLITHVVTASTSAAYPVGMLINSVTARVIDNELPPVVGLEFDVPGQPKPTNWAQQTFLVGNQTDLFRDDGVPTPIDLSNVNLAGGTANTAPTAITASSSVPLHVPDLAAVDGASWDTFPIRATYSSLTPGANYGVYVLAAEYDPGGPYSQTVSIQGATTLPTFTQTTTDGVLRINGEAGSSARTFKSYELVVAANASGQIRIDVFPTGAAPIVLAGLAIREIPPAVPGITVQPTDLAGVQRPALADGQPPPPGKSPAPAFQRDANISPENLGWLHEDNRAIRVGDWTLVAAKGDPRELYDLRTDRAEQRNLATSMSEKVGGDVAVLGEELEGEGDVVGAAGDDLAIVDDDVRSGVGRQELGLQRWKASNSGCHLPLAGGGPTDGDGSVGVAVGGAGLHSLSWRRPLGRSRIDGRA